MSWIRLDDGWDENPKVLAVSEAAAMMWLRAITFSNRRKTNGFIPVGALHRLTPNKNPTKLAEELAEVRAHGYQSGLFDRVESGGYRVHDHGNYQPDADGNLPRKQASDDVRAKRSAAGRRGSDARWHRRTAPGGTVPAASEPSATGGEGTLPMTEMASLPPPDPVPEPVHTLAVGERACARPVVGRDLAIADVWLAAVNQYPALSLIHNDQAWANELAGTAASRGTRADDAEAAVAAFVDKHAGKRWSHRDELVRALGGFTAKAKAFGDDARTRAAASSRGAATSNPRARTTVNWHRGPLPNPAGASGLDLDDGSHDRRPTP